MTYKPNKLKKENKSQCLLIVIIASIVSIFVGIFLGSGFHSNKPILEPIPLEQSLLGAPPELVEMAKKMALKHQVDISLIFAMIKQESNWKSNVVSHAGAIGIMQIMPSTGRSFCGLSKKQLYNPHLNLDCGIRYLKKQLERFGSMKLALCAYNAGPGRVAKLKRCPRFKETTNYVNNILRLRGSK
jgi:soluble lytic murein transglycosylase-like protein